MFVILYILCIIQNDKLLHYFKNYFPPISSSQVTAD